MRSLFVGTLLDGSHEVEVVVKFTATYNEEVHKLLAEKGLAPKLYACQRVIGNLFMVVMERIDGKPLAFDVPRGTAERYGVRGHHAGGGGPQGA
jgi:hypothetical protein